MTTSNALFIGMVIGVILTLIAKRMSRKMLIETARVMVDITAVLTIVFTAYFQTHVILMILSFVWLVLNRVVFSNAGVTEGRNTR